MREPDGGSAEAEVDFLCKRAPDHKRSIIFDRKACGGQRVKERDTVAEIHPLSDTSGWLPVRALPLPAPAEHGGREMPSTDNQGVTASLSPLLTRETRSLDKWVRDFVRGLVLPSGEEEPTTHFIYYIICDCVQFDDTLMMVSMYGIFGIWLSQDGM